MQEWSLRWMEDRCNLWTFFNLSQFVNGSWSSFVNNEFEVTPQEEEEESILIMIIYTILTLNNNQLKCLNVSVKINEITRRVLTLWATNPFIVSSTKLPARHDPENNILFEKLYTTPTNLNILFFKIYISNVLCEKGSRHLHKIQPAFDKSDMRN